MLTNDQLDRSSGAELFFKCEGLQPPGAFKVRGAANAVFGLADAVAERGVITHAKAFRGRDLWEWPVAELEDVAHLELREVPGRAGPREGHNQPLGTDEFICHTQHGGQMNSSVPLGLGPGREG